VPILIIPREKILSMYEDTQNPLQYEDSKKHQFHVLVNALEIYMLSGQAKALQVYDNTSKYCIQADEKRNHSLEYVALHE
jgi:hypothetical protein